MNKNAERLTGGLAQAGQWLARKFVRIWKFIARSSVSESPAFAKPLGCCMQTDEMCREKNDVGKNNDRNTLTNF